VHPADVHKGAVALDRAHHGLNNTADADSRFQQRLALHLTGLSAAHEGYLALVIPAGDDDIAQFAHESFIAIVDLLVEFRRRHHADQGLAQRCGTEKNLNLAVMHGGYGNLKDLLSLDGLANLSEVKLILP